MSNTDQFSKLLNMTPLSEDSKTIQGVEHEVEIVESQKEILVRDYEEQKREYEAIKDNLLEIIEQGRGALDDVSQLASSSQDHKYYDVLSKVMNSLVSANKELIQLVRAKSESINPYVEAAPKEQKNVTNNLFVGSTAELLAFIKGKAGDDSSSG